MIPSQHAVSREAILSATRGTPLREISTILVSAFVVVVACDFAAADNVEWVGNQSGGLQVGAAASFFDANQ